jgi:hypothetical protein
MSTAVKTAAKKGSAPTWTCDRCDMTISYLPGHERRTRPNGWAKQGGGTYCLACRRSIAAETAYEAAPADMPMEKRAKLRATAVIDFEIKRDPDRPNGEIAKIVRCSVPAVLKARKRLAGEKV